MAKGRASMWPRSRERGNRDSIPAMDVLAYASMWPRSRERGNEAILTLPEPHRTLQCGRAHVSAETINFRGWPRRSGRGFNVAALT